MQRLGAAQHAGQRLDRRADVVERLLGGQRHARGLHVRAHQQALRVARPERVAQLARPDRRAARYLAISSKKSMCALKKKLQARRELVGVEPAVDRLLHVGEAVLERERQLLRRRRARLADVVAGDRDRMPRGSSRADHSIMSPSRRIAGSTGKHHSFWAMYSLRMSAWIVPAVPRDAVLLGGDDVVGEHDRRRRVDRHRDGHLAEVDPGEQRLHVVERVDRHALATDLAQRAHVV